MRIEQEEIFGPVISAFKFSAADDLVEPAHSVKYGLAGGVWTRDLKRAASRRGPSGSTATGRFTGPPPLADIR